MNKEQDGSAESEDETSGTSVVIQCLRVHLPMQGCEFDPWSGS